MKDEDDSLSNDTTTESSSSEQAPFEVTLSSLLIKNLAEHLNETDDGTLEKITLQMASNISSSLRDSWNLSTIKQNNSLNDLPMYNTNPFDLNLDNIVLLTKRKSEREIW